MHTIFRVWNALAVVVIAWSSLSAQDVTKPFVLAGTTLHVNVDAKAGELNVTVLDGDGQTVAVAEPVTGDQPRGSLRWKSGNLDSFKGKSVSLRLSLRNAHLYSFWSE